jgi:hypothetical protein
MAKDKRCPCGSGRKHKNCCGREKREIPLGPEAMQAIQSQLQMFREKFGRDPEPEEPIFFDPDSPVPKPFNVDDFTARMVKLMREAGIRPALIWAFVKTGRIVSDQNMHLLTQDDLDEWAEAIREYEENPEKN